MAASHWRADSSMLLWSCTTNCAQKGFQNPTPLTLGVEPRVRPLTRAFIMCSWFIVHYPGCQTGYSQLSNLNRQRLHVYPFWVSDIWCPAVITPEEWTLEALLGDFFQGAVHREGCKSFTEHRGGRLWSWGCKGAQWGNFCWLCTYDLGL